jgi:hypothetical protein
MSRASHARRVVGAVAAGSVLALLLAGCVPDSGGIPGRLERGLSSAQSSAQTGLLTLRALSAGRTSPQQAETAIDDALTKLGDEQTSLAGVDPRTRAERRWRRSADDAMSSLDAALKDARSAAGGEAGIRWSRAKRELTGASRAIQHAKRTLVHEAGERE